MAGELTAVTTDLTISGALRRQFQRAFHILRDAMQQLDDLQWPAGEVDWLIPARQVLHGLSSVDFYSRPAPVFGLSKKQFVDWEKASPDELPTRAEMLEYLEKIALTTDAWLASLSDAQLLVEETQFAWTGRSILDRAMYCLRHLQHHTAIVNSELRRRGLKRGEWQ